MNEETQDTVVESENPATEEETSQEETPTEDQKDWESLYENQKKRAEKAEARLKELQPKEETPKVETPKQDLSKSDELDYGQKAYLRSYDIKGAEELQLVKDWMKRTGDTLDSLVEDDIFQAKLGKLREAKAVAEAVPKSTRRSAQVAKDDVQYWTEKINSGQASLQDIDNVDLRRKVLNARVEHERVGNRFSDSPVQFN